MELHGLKPTPKSRGHRAKIVGRGHGSGLGKTSGRGQKGQKARKSGRTRIGFEGGQTPLYRRLPKFGFSTAGFRRRCANVGLAAVAACGRDALARADFVALGWIANKSKDPVKLIGNAKVDRAITVEVQKASAAAKRAIEAAGGKVVIVGLPAALASHRDQSGK